MSLKRWVSSLFGRSASAEQPLLTPDELAQWYESQGEAGRRAITDELGDRVRGRESVRTGGKDKRAKAVGRLVFEVDGPDGPVPLHHMKVELWDRDPGSPDDYLGEGVTDADGRFEIPYDPDDAGAFDLPDLDLRVFEPHHTFRRDGTVLDRWRRIWSVEGADDFDGLFYDFEDVRIPYWEYADGLIPRVMIPEEGQAPTAYAPGRNLAMLKAVAPIEIVKRKHLGSAASGADIDLLSIQNDYPPSLTRSLEKERPGYTRSDEYFGLRFMNGMLAGPMDRDPEDPDRYWVYHHWNSYPQDGVHCLPNVAVRFEVEDGVLMPVVIDLWLREPGATAGGSPTTHHRIEKDDDDWAAAKRLARISATLDTELGSHLAQCHLNAEQYAIAAQRHLRRSPIRWLLQPHLREVVLINQSAGNFLIGDSGYITRACALTEDGINQRLVQLMGSFDWKGWAPAPPISDKHHYARAGNLFWEILTNHIDAFIEEHRAAIEASWVEIERFADDLVRNSAEFFACGYLQSHVIGRPAEWFQRKERMDLEAEREEHGGVRRVVSRIETVEDLAQVCRYIIFMTTFRHAWANNKQWDDGGEVLYTCLGLRWGDHGVLVGEDDLSVAPDAGHATEMLWISYMLSKTQYGFLLRNEEEDVHPRFVDMLREKVKTFAELELDLDTVSSRINI